MEKQLFTMNPRQDLSSYAETRLLDLLWEKVLDSFSFKGPNGLDE